MAQGLLHSAATSPRATATDAFPGRMLYVEDDARVADITCLMLEEMGLEIVQARSAEEALRITEGEGSRFDIVLTDVVMGGLSGVHLARRLNRLWPDMPIVLLSGYGDDLVHGYGSEFELLRKPFTSGALLDCLQRHLDGSVYQPA